MSQASPDITRYSDPQLPFLELAWSRERMSKLPVFGLFWPGRSLESLNIDHMTYTPGKHCVLLYSVRLAGVAEPARVVATFEGDDRLAGLYPTLSERDGNGAQGTVTPSGYYLPEYRCVVEQFPADYMLPALRPAMDPVHLSALSESHDSPPPREADLGSVSVLRYRPHKRCVLLYTPADRRPERIVKVYPGGGRAIKAMAAMTSLHAQSTALGVTVPKPVGQFGDLVLMERLEGESMKRSLSGAALTDARPMVARAAEALAALHRMHVQASRVRTFEREIDAVRSRAEKLREAAPGFVRRVQGLIDQLAAIDRGYVGEWCYTHGDFKPAQILVHGDRVSVVDFDHADVGDPALDVGKFMAELYKESLDAGRASARDLADCFLSAYQVRARREGLEHGALLFFRLALLRMAIRRFRQAPLRGEGHGMPSPPMLLLAEAEASFGSMGNGD